MQFGRLGAHCYIAHGLGKRLAHSKIKMPWDYMFETSGCLAATVQASPY